MSETSSRATRAPSPHLLPAPQPIRQPSSQAEEDRPSWGHKLLLYAQGEATVEKRGYFVASKLEEMAVRFIDRTTNKGVVLLHSLLSLALSPLLPSFLALATRMGVGKGGEGALEWVRRWRGGRTKGEGRAGEARREEGSQAGSHRRGATNLATMELGWWSLFEQTTLRAPAYDHVMIAFRHKDADTHAGGNKEHIALGLFRNVPKVDLDLILPHQQVKISHANHSITTPRSTPAPRTTLHANIPYQNTVHSAHHKTITRSTPPHHTTTSLHTYDYCDKAAPTQPHLESPNHTAFQVCMPSLHRTQFALMGLLTLGAGYPLLHQVAIFRACSDPPARCPLSACLY